MKENYQERNRISRELYNNFASDLADISFRIDEAIGLNSTNAPTRDSLRSIRESISTIVDKSRHHRETSFELTNREKEVLTILATGSATKEICAQLFLSQATVKTHLAAIYRKLGASNRVEALNRAKQLGILS